MKGSKDRRLETSECLRDTALVVDTEVMRRPLVMGGRQVKNLWFKGVNLMEVRAVDPESQPDMGGGAAWEED